MGIWDLFQTNETKDSEGKKNNSKNNKKDNKRQIKGKTSHVKPEQKKQKNERKNVEKKNPKPLTTSPKHKTQSPNPIHSSKPTKHKVIIKKAEKHRPVRKTNSMESVFTIKKGITVDQFGTKLTSHNGSPVDRTIYDVCAYVILCPKHNNILVSIEEKASVVWLPFVSLPRKNSWNTSAIDGANIILSNGNAETYVWLQNNPVITDCHCIQLFRLQLPQTQKFNVRLIFFVKLNDNHKHWKCCVDTKRLVWVPLDEVNKSKVKNLWGPELVEFSRFISGSNAMIDRIDEYSLDEAFRYVPRDPPRNLEEEMLKSTNYTEKDVERLYTDFIEHCFPAFFMTQTSFNHYMSKYGFEKMDKKLKLMFSAFNYNKNGFLGFHEFLLGLTSIDPNATNGQSRIKFLFKYFDVDSDGFLNEKEFTSMIREMNPQKSEKEIQNITKVSMKLMGTKKLGVHFDDFFKAVGAHQFRGTSSLCRSNLPILQQISRAMATKTLRKGTGRWSLGSIINDKKYKGICKSCREKRFEFAIHLVSLSEDGRWVDAKPLPELSQIEKTNVSNETIKTNPRSDSRLNTSQVSLRTSSSTAVTGLSSEKFSTEIVWNKKSVANYFMEQIRAFNLIKGSHKENKGLLNAPNEREGFVKKLENLCNEVKRILAQEDRCVQLISPAYVIGDIHGNIEDLMTMERVLWNSLPIVSASYVFLGDYVDRGKWGLECAIYILCMKLLAPNKVVMLRGNHEVRDLQIHYSYKKECCDKYGDALGCKVWEITNLVFDKLPFSAVIDDAIYCAHGGIPCTTKLIEKINEVKTDLKNPEKESAIAWEILWSDPIGAQQFSETADLLQIRVDTARGFLTNTKRGTAFLFNEEAANNFLQHNGLTHIIRAHEVPAQGFTFHFGNKCTTVFSSSHYCGNNNNSACVHIDNEKLRIVCLDTVNNAPASD